MYALTYLLIPQLVSAVAINGRGNPNRAAYFLNNDPAGASIVSLKINPNDGTLSSPVVTWTGGKGLYGLTASSTGGAPAAGGADTLFTQDSVVVSQDYLFTVNPGSNTVSMFFIDNANPQYPKLLNTAPSLGEFPSSVAYSPSLKTACVVNGGAVAGVACFSTDHAKGLTPLGGLRPITLAGQTTPPVGPPNTVSDIVFNPSQTALIVTVKGNGVTPGYIYAYPVSHGSISWTPVISRPSELAIDFSISFLGSDHKAVITDPSYGASLVEIDDNFVFTVSKKIPIAGEAAVCWSQYSARFNTIFIMDGGVTNVTLIDPGTGAIKGLAVQSAAGAGSLDSKLDQTYLYVLKGAPLIGVSDVLGLNEGKLPVEIQSFDLSSLGSRQGFQGLSIYPSCEFGFFPSSHVEFRLLTSEKNGFELWNLEKPVKAF